MSTIDKLRINGIRSFSPDNKCIIKFYKPLTLIVGQNGAGKTTIIECLKFSTTGEYPPPNTNNAQNFIHDPKVAGEREVKAQVKLQFFNALGKAVVCTRNLQLTQKANKLEARAQDATVQMENQAGKKTSMSYRCADLDKLIPSLMGVSKPVLDNVIFCHQEDSNWPLSDSASLKKKFDDIFSATRYRKALDVIKKQKKAQEEDTRVYKAELKSFDHLKEQSDENERKIRATEEKMEVIKKEIVLLDEEIVDCKNQMGKVNETVKAVRKFHGDINAVKSTIAAKTQAKEELREACNEIYTETEEELRECSRTLESTLADIKRKQAQLEADVAKSEAEQQRLRKENNEQLRLHGKLEAEEEHYRSQLVERGDRIKTLAAKYSLGGYGVGELSTEESKSFLDVLMKRLEQKLNDMHSIQAKYGKNERDAGLRVQQLQAKRTSVTESTKLKQHQNDRLNDSIMEVQNSLDRVAAVSRGPDDVEHDLKKQKERLGAIRNKANFVSMEQKLQDLKQEKAQVDQQIPAVNEKIRYLLQQTEGQAAVKVKRKDKELKDQQYKQLEGDVRPRLEQLLGRSVPPRDAAEAVRAEISRRSQDVARAVDEHTHAQSERTALQSEVDALAQQLKMSSNERRAKETKISKKTAGRPFLELLQETEEELEHAQKSASEANSTSEAARQLYSKFLGSGKHKRSCPLCKRGLEEEAEYQLFVSNIEKVLAKLNSLDVKEDAKEISEKEFVVNQLRGLKPLYDTCQRLRSEIPALEDKRNAKVVQLDKLNAKLDATTAQLAERRKGEQVAKDLRPDAERLTRLYEEVVRLDREIQEHDVKFGNAEGPRALESATDKLEMLQKLSTELNGKLDRMRVESDRSKADLHAAERNVSALQQELLRVQSVMEKKQRLTSELHSLTGQRNRLDEELKDLEKRARPIEEELQRAEKDRATIQLEMRAHRKTADAEYNLVQRDVDWLETATLATERYEKANKGKRAAESNATMDRIIKALATADREHKDASQRLSATRNAIANHDTQIRDMTDNLKLREYERDLKELELAIRNIKSDLSKIPSANTCVADFQKLEGELTDMRMERAELVGHMKPLESQLADIMKAQNNPIYKDAKGNFRKKLIELKTTEMANTDLTKYHHALDKALLKFHTLKMNEINKIIKELWQKTYRNNDIDTVEIRSDTEGQKSNYNYRVVMLKQGTELNMRGRCSAGQKVLASLIIRLALAETFCLSCGILALDEPTTNLDHANIESFAKALVQIIHDRSKQSNFQLIVITHDEKFVSLLSGAGIDYYWRVGKDDAGYSTIGRQDIVDLDT